MGVAGLQQILDANVLRASVLGLRITEWARSPPRRVAVKMSLAPIPPRRVAVKMSLAPIPGSAPIPGCTYSWLHLFLRSKCLWHLFSYSWLSARWCWGCEFPNGVTVNHAVSQSKCLSQIVSGTYSWLTVLRKKFGWHLFQQHPFQHLLCLSWHLAWRLYHNAELTT